MFSLCPPFGGGGYPIQLARGVPHPGGQGGGVPCLGYPPPAGVPTLPTPYPRQSRIACTCCTAGSMPLAFRYKWQLVLFQNRYKYDPEDAAYRHRSWVLSLPVPSASETRSCKRYSTSSPYEKIRIEQLKVQKQGLQRCRSRCLWCEHCPFKGSFTYSYCDAAATSLPNLIDCFGVVLLHLVTATSPPNLIYCFGVVLLHLVTATSPPNLIYCFGVVLLHLATVTLLPNLIYCFSAVLLHRATTTLLRCHWGITLWAIRERRRRRVAVAGCKWALNLRLPEQLQLNHPRNRMYKMPL